MEEWKGNGRVFRKLKMEMTMKSENMKKSKWKVILKSNVSEIYRAVNQVEYE